MAVRRATMMDPPIGNLLRRVDATFIDTTFLDTVGIAPGAER